jgi:putative transposase
LRNNESATSSTNLCDVYQGTEVTELRRQRQLEEENRELTQLMADLTPDKQMIQEVIRKKL